jgi:hypothetical protein
MTDDSVYNINLFGSIKQVDTVARRHSAKYNRNPLAIAVTLVLSMFDGLVDQIHEVIREANHSYSIG